MKKLSLLLCLAVSLILSSCKSNEESYSQAVYQALMEIRQMSSVVSNNSDASALANKVIADIGAVDTKYKKEWIANLSDKSDAEAVTIYNNAMRELEALKAAFETSIAEKDYGKGSFTIVCGFITRRTSAKGTVTLKESDDVEFTYSSVN